MLKKLTLAAAAMGSLVLAAPALADDGHRGHGRGHFKHHHRQHFHHFNPRPVVVMPPPRVFYAPPAPVYYAPPAVVYRAYMDAPTHAKVTGDSSLAIDGALR